MSQLYTTPRRTWGEKGGGLTAPGDAGSIRFRIGRVAATGCQVPADGKELAP